jgi:hypothetical protein
MLILFQKMTLLLRNNPPKLDSYGWMLRPNLAVEERES